MHHRNNNSNKSNGLWFSGLFENGKKNRYTYDIVNIANPLKTETSGFPLASLSKNHKKLVLNVRQGPCTLPQEPINQIYVAECGDSATQLHLFFCYFRTGCCAGMTGSGRFEQTVSSETHWKVF